MFFLFKNCAMWPPQHDVGKLIETLKWLATNHELMKFAFPSTQPAITRSLSSARIPMSFWTTSQPQIPDWDFKHSMHHVSHHLRYSPFFQMSLQSSNPFPLQLRDVHPRSSSSLQLFVRNLFVKLPPKNVSWNNYLFNGKERKKNLLFFHVIFLHLIASLNSRLLFGKEIHQVREMK